MSDEKKKRGRKNLVERKELRNEAKELVLQNYTPSQIAKALNVSYPTALDYIKYWQLYYTKLALNNSHIAQQQATRIITLQDEVKLVQQKYWQLYKEIEEKINEEKEDKAKQVALLQEALDSLDPEGQPKEYERAKHTLASAMSSSPTSYINTRLDILRSVMSRIESEQRLISLFTPTKLLQQNYVSLDVLKEVIAVFQSIIIDLIPKDKQQYAVARMKKIQVTSLDGSEVVDAEFKEME